MKIKLLIPAVCFLLNGCATTSHVWYQNNKSSTEAWQDYSDSQIIATKTVNPTGVSPIVFGGLIGQSIAQGNIDGQEKNLIEARMRGKGYAVVAATNSVLTAYPVASLTHPDITSSTPPPAPPSKNLAK